MNNEYLPIGSIVLLNGGIKKVMVIGYFFNDPTINKNKVFDYLGAMYPEGVFTLENFLAFDNKDISKIYNLGFSDEEQKHFSKKLIEMKQKYINQNNELIEDPNKIIINEIKGDK